MSSSRNWCQSLCYDSNASKLGVNSLVAYLLNSLIGWRILNKNGQLAPLFSIKKTFLVFQIICMRESSH